ncbi:MAG: hypothetical protein LBE36_09275 [Flavobacteriaceae bacterium]|nr:hypothetical protein [Flavobacteriaceae bacterium]
MKHVLIILSTFLLLGCKDDNENSSNPAQLPPATQTGKNTAGCLVNGKVLLPDKGSIIDGGPALAAHYQYLDGGYHFGLGITNVSNNNVEGITIGSHNISFEEGHIYELSEELWDDTQIYASASFGSTIYGYQYNTTNIHTGELKITHLDTTNYIISGTFWFDAVNSNGEKVEVREGRFDLHYAP